MWRTRLVREYGIELPFVSAGMGFVAMPELAAAVSNAGGLGLLGFAPLPPDAIEDVLRRTRALTARPYGVDFIIEDTALGPSTVESHIDVVVAARVPVVVFFWNLPPREWIDRLHRAGSRVWMQIGSVERARDAVAAGMDALIVQGSEAGGHNKSTLTLATLLPTIVDAVAPVPLIAAGGIVDGRAVAAALALGADGVCVGTRLVASVEAYAHDEYKRRIVAASTGDVTSTPIFGPEWPDAPMKVLRNRVVAEWGNETRTPSAATSPPIGTTRLFGRDYPMPKFSVMLPTPQTSGDFEEMCLPAGEGVGKIDAILPAADIVRSMMRDAETAIGRLSAITRP